MKELVCKTCGGKMVLDASGMTAVCQYCNNKALLDHEDTDYYRDYFARMNTFFSSSNDEKKRKENAEIFWEDAKEITFICENGTPVRIKYMYCYSDKDANVYVARRNIVFHFRENGAEKANQFRKNISLLDYPTADTRNLEEFFPRITGGFLLDDGSYICVIAKNEDEYPLRLFGILPGRHVAWIISRMENLCCVLEFSSLVHPTITLDTLYINPYTHQASLYGNWWDVGKYNTYSYDGRTLLHSGHNLMGVRNTAVALLGYSDKYLIKQTEDVPKAFVDFLKSSPKINAYEDFAYWDEMMIQAYGERKFVTLSADDSKVYGKRG